MIGLTIATISGKSRNNMNEYKQICMCGKQTFSSSIKKLRLMISLFCFGFLVIHTRKILPNIFCLSFECLLKFCIHLTA